MAGAVFEKGNASPTDGLNSMFILVFAFIGTVLKSITTCWYKFSEETGVSPFKVVVKTDVLADAPCVRIIGLVLGVDKTIFIFVKSIAGAPGERPIVNLMSSIPADGLDAMP